MLKSLPARKYLIMGAVVLAAVLGGGLGVSSMVSTVCACVTPSPQSSLWPTVTGLTITGQTLSSDNGTWVTSGDLQRFPNTNYSYAWQRCDSSGASCAAISSATTPTYVLQSADVGSTIRSAVTAFNVGGSTTQTSKQTSAVVGPGSSSGSTLVADSVTGTTATLHGQGSCATAPCQAWFQYSTDNFATFTATAHTSVTAAGFTLDVPIAGLTAATTYEYRLAVSENGGATKHWDSTGAKEGTNYTTFRTTGGISSAGQTQAATNITNTTATLHGTGACATTPCVAWYQWSTDSFATDITESAHTTVTAAGFSLDQPITGLTQGTQYQVRLVTQENGGQLQFWDSSGTGIESSAYTTFQTTGTVGSAGHTTAATSVTSTTATLNGQGSCAVSPCTAWFQWSKDGFSTFNASAHQTVTAAGFTQNVPVTALTTGATYEYRMATSENGGTTKHWDSSGTPEGTNYSNFATPGGAGTTSGLTTDATSITNTAATLNGQGSCTVSPCTAWFQWSTDGFATFSSSTHQTVTAAGFTQNVAVTGLTAGTQYQFRLLTQENGGAINTWDATATQGDTNYSSFTTTGGQLTTAPKLALYYEQEGQGEPSLAQVQSDLNYILANYASNTDYYHINGKPVLWVYGDATDSCSTVSKWVTANAGRFYIGMKVFSGYASCSSQPDAWHQYGPAVNSSSFMPWSINISPGFWQCNDPTQAANATYPYLARSLSRFTTDIQAANTTGPQWEMITSFNEWCEGSAVEPATEWASSSGNGTFLDALHNNPYTGGIRAIFYYPWFPETENWNTHYHPILGKYDSGDPTIIAEHAAMLSWGKIDVAIASWWGQGTPTDGRVAALLSGFGGSGGGGGGGPPPPPPPPPGSDPVIAAAGDISCQPPVTIGSGTCHEAETAQQVLSLNPDAVLTLGDNQYEQNSPSQYTGSGAYNDTWGAFKAKIHPGIGNHEYLTTGATGYNGYFGSAATGGPNNFYYSFNLGDWHIISLNSECSNIGSCSPTSPEYTWLQNDLNSHSNACTLAYYHEPRWSSGQHGNAVQMKDIWNLMVSHHVDVVLNGHNHVYERLPLAGASSDTSQLPANPPPQDPNGIREFLAGTGGKNHYAFTATAFPNEVRNDKTYGILKLTLHPTSYDWKFLPESGLTFTDSGTDNCR